MTTIHEWPALLQVLFYILAVDIPLLILFMTHCTLRQYNFEYRADQAKKHGTSLAIEPPNHLSTMMAYLFFVLLFNGAVIAAGLNGIAGLIMAFSSIIALGNSSLAK
jgi:hypothetical protein